MRNVGPDSNSTKINKSLHLLQEVQGQEQKEVTIS